jgi:hypothetical protein
MHVKQLKNKWKIISTDQWDVEPGWYIEFCEKRSGSFHFGYMQASIDYWIDTETNRTEFTFHGNDELDEIFGSCWVKIDGVNLQGHLHFHNGDDVCFSAKKSSRK